MRRSDKVLLGTAGILLLVQLGTPPLWGAEGRWACIAREMIESGNFFFPTINGQLYYEKPLFSYWVVVLLSWPFGVSEWTVRIPAVLSAILAIWATVRIGDKVWGDGTPAGWILLTSYGFVTWAHRGMSDLMAVSLMVVSIWSYLRAVENPSRRWWIVGWAVMALAAQSKGLTGFIVPLLVIGLHVCFKKNGRSLLHVGQAWGILAAILLYFGPFYISYMWGGDEAIEGLRHVYSENFTRYFDPFDHKNPIDVYLRSVPLYALPWCIFWFVAIWGMWKGRKDLSAEAKWLPAAMILIVIFFCFSGSRREYYILPFLPFASLFVSGYVPGAKVSSVMSGIVFVLMGIASFVAPIVTRAEIAEYLRFHIIPLGIVSLAAVAGGMGIIFVRSFRSVVVAAVALWAAVWWVAAPCLDTEDRALKEFTQEVRKRVPDSDIKRLMIYSAREARLIYYFGAPGTIPSSIERWQLEGKQEEGIDRVITFPFDIDQVEWTWKKTPVFTLRERRLPWVTERQMETRYFMYAEFSRP